MTNYRHKSLRTKIHFRTSGVQKGVMWKGSYLTWHIYTSGWHPLPPPCGRSFLMTLKIFNESRSILRIQNLYFLVRLLRVNIKFVIVQSCLCCNYIPISVVWIKQDILKVILMWLKWENEVNKWFSPSSSKVSMLLFQELL